MSGLTIRIGKKEKKHSGNWYWFAPKGPVAAEVVQRLGGELAHQCPDFLSRGVQRVLRDLGPENYHPLRFEYHPGLLNHEREIFERSFHPLVLGREDKLYLRG